MDPQHRADHGHEKLEWQHRMDRQQRCGEQLPWLHSRKGTGGLCHPPDGSRHQACPAETSGHRAVPQQSRQR